MKILEDYREVNASQEASGVDMRVVIGPGDNAPNFIMRIFEVQPGSSTPFHTHSWEHEVYVISGQGIVRSESSETHIVAGSIVYVAPDERHCFSNVGGEPFRFVCVIPKTS